ncbi:MAG: DUF58 domain-containing protein [Leptospira sp.]|nr:DUF58 domain-containing protein [Leptospira sp.]
MDLIRPELYKLVGLLEVRARKWIHGNRLSGNHFHNRGRGMEFRDVREYEQGDDIRHIDWNVTSRTGDLHVKEFFQERDLPVILFLDVSSSMVSSGLKMDAAFQILVLLLMVHSKAGNQCQVLLFDHDWVYRSDTIRTRDELWRQAKKISNCIQSRKNSIHSTNHELPLKFLQNQVLIRSLVYLISDFANFSGDVNWKKNSFRHDVNAFYIQDSFPLDDVDELKNFFCLVPTESNSLATNYSTTKLRDEERMRSQFHNRLKTIPVNQDWTADLIAILGGGV